MNALHRSIRGSMPYIAAAIGILFIWQAVVVVTQPSPMLLPSPALVASTLGDLFTSGEMFVHAGFSLGRVSAAWLLAVAIAIPLGLAQGSSPAVDRFLDPVVELFRPISPLAWIPLAILWFGIGESGKVFVIFIATFFPILLNTVSGVKSVDPVLIRAGQVLGCRTKLQLFRHVILPAAMPSIMVGLRISFGTGWAAIIAAELVAANRGLGFLIADGMEILRSDRVLAGMIIIGVLGVLIDTAFRVFGKKIRREEHS